MSSNLALAEPTEETQVSEEELAFRSEFQAKRERTERENKCDQALAQVFKDHNCVPQTFFQAGEHLVTTQIVVWPVVIKSVAK